MVCLYVQCKPGTKVKKSKEGKHEMITILLNPKNFDAIHTY